MRMRVPPAAPLSRVARRRPPPGGACRTAAAAAMATTMTSMTSMTTWISMRTKWVVAGPSTRARRTTRTRRSRRGAGRSGGMGAMTRTMTNSWTMRRVGRRRIATPPSSSSSRAKRTLSQIPCWPCCSGCVWRPTSAATGGRAPPTPSRPSSQPSPHTTSPSPLHCPLPPTTRTKRPWTSTCPTTWCVRWARCGSSKRWRVSWYAC
mmetsp:Transcript_8433/g.20659  ORF Transcript_8433/g.20659 Transcript_8433/m.20659 type:complete len:206 (+) Transcript_8433:233-850(+)